MPAWSRKYRTSPVEPRATSYLGKAADDRYVSYVVVSLLSAFPNAWCFSRRGADR